MERLDQFLNSLKYLPPAPTVLPELLRRLSRPDLDTSEIVTLLTFDPGLTATILRVANSAFFGAAEPASTLAEAVTRLGYHQVLLLVATICGATTLSQPKSSYGLDAGQLWRHSVATALAAETLAQTTGQDINVAFTAGLLHDLGKIVLAEALEGKPDGLFAHTERRGQSRLESERAVLGLDHAEVGGRLLTRWQFAEPLAAAVTHHHSPAAAGQHRRLAACVHLGNLIAHSLGLCSGAQALAVDAHAAALDFLGLAPERWPHCVLRGLDRFQQMRSLVNVRQTA